jgi:hypothetical protein
MDPSLQELLTEISDPEEELEVLMRLVLPDAVPENVKVVARFGDVITCRIRRKHIEEVYTSPLKFSMKASKYFINDLLLDAQPLSEETVQPPASIKHEPDLPESNVIVAVIDWGCDFTHPNFRNLDGTTRLLGIWDQTNTKNNGIHPYGYGCFFGANDINRALKTSKPFLALQYHPSKADNAGIGAHGTHVMDIAAGKGVVGKPGIAPNAKLLFVHLGAGDTSGINTLGDSVRILEAIDFVRKMAEDKPLVINLSVGRHGGPHDGNTLVERAIDNLLSERDNTMVCQSTGNYYNTNTHAAGIVRPGKMVPLSFIISKADTTPNELEIWYSGKDSFSFTIKNAELRISAELGEKKDIIHNGVLLGRIYHRERDPVNLKNHINVFLYSKAPSDLWHVSLSGKKITDGRFNAWIERDSGCKGCQAKFINSHVTRTGTTGTICNGYNSLVVGAYNHNSPEFEFGHFSSQGPTTDGRCKPDLLAPGVRIVAAKSAGRNEPASTGKLTVMSGTSMATPHVAGAVARILEILPARTPFYIIKNIICGSADRIKADRENFFRAGNGLLNLTRAIRAAKIYRLTTMNETSGKENSLTQAPDVV